MSPKPLSSDMIGQREKFLLYGEPKTGKTFCAGTLPEPIYYLAIGGDNEPKTFLGKDFIRKHGKKDIQFDEIKETRGARGIVNEPSGFDDACIALDEALEMDDKGTFQFASIVVDNATILSEMQMAKAIAISHMGAKAGKETTMDKYEASGILTPYDNDWGAAQSLMRQFVSWLFNIDKHVALIAHEHKETTTDRKTRTQQIVAVKPQFIGKDRDQISNIFDNVWRFSRNGQLYVARTTPLGSPFPVIAGSRIGGIVDENYSDPNLADVIEEYKDYAKEYDTTE